MVHVVLFHSGLGLRPQVLAWAERLRGAGHVVVTPDLFDGEVFDNLDDGVKKRDALGIEELSKRTQLAVAEVPVDAVYAGFSMGAASAQSLALMRPGARGAFLMHAALPLSAFGAEAWPEGVRVAIHAAEGDPWVDWGVIDDVAGRGDVVVERYAGDGHLFADDGAPEYDPDQAERLFASLCTFIDEAAAGA